MNLSELPHNFSFVFVPELNGAGYVFRLVEGSPRCYLAEDLKDWMQTDLDECLELLRYADLSKLSLRSIDLPILQRLKYNELKQSGQLNQLDEEDRWLVKLLRF
jgi:hypothetical protein